MSGAQEAATTTGDAGSLQALRVALVERGPGRADLPLDGVIVLDFSKILAGPLCTQYLGELGATVIKIETAEGGDDTRAWPPFTGRNGTVFLSVNRNKRSLALDLRSPRGLALAHRLARVADVAIENFSPGVAERLRIDHASLAAINPRLVYCSISGFGSVGPLRAGKGYDVILQAFSGMLSITGEEGGPPVRAAYSPVDQATGLHAVIGILGGLMRQGRTGHGMKVEASLFDSALSFLAYVLQGYWERGVDPRPAGSGHESLCPYQSFETADKPMMLGIANDALWRRFCALVARPEWANDPRFATGAARVAQRAVTVELVQDILRTRTRAQWLGSLDEAGIPCSPIHAISELAAHPHTVASGMTFDYGSMAAGACDAAAMRGVSIPLRLNGERLRPIRRPPEVGEHSLEILEQMGLGREEIDSLVAEGIVGRREPCALGV